MFGGCYCLLFINDSLFVSFLSVSLSRSCSKMFPRLLLVRFISDPLFNVLEGGLSLWTLKPSPKFLPGRLSIAHQLQSAPLIHYALIPSVNKLTNFLSDLRIAVPLA